MWGWGQAMVALSVGINIMGIYVEVEAPPTVAQFTSERNGCQCYVALAVFAGQTVLVPASSSEARAARGRQCPACPSARARRR